MQDIHVCLAGIPIGISSRSGFMAGFCRDYLTDAAPRFTVSVTEDQIRQEVLACAGKTTADYAEALCLYREIAERLPCFNRAVFHGAAIAYEGKAYLFTAPSGTGKTTHISLWKQYLGEAVTVINGDKPILERTPDGGVTVYGAPFAGKERWQRNTAAPLGGICLIVRGTDNSIRPITPGEAFPRLFAQMYRPYTAEAVAASAALLRALCAVPCFELRCDISAAAVRSSYTALTQKTPDPVLFNR